MSEHVSTSLSNWLLDSDPAIRWQVMDALIDETEQVVAAERARVASNGWGAQLLALQEPDGRWDGGTYRPGWVDEDKPFFDAWTATHFALGMLREFGLDPSSSKGSAAVSLVAEKVGWDGHGTSYFEGETEPCINGAVIANGAYFGREVDGIVDIVLDQQLDDGGWNCWAEEGAIVASFHTTICVLEGLLAWERAGGESKTVSAAKSAGEEYLLDRQLYLSRSTGEVVDPRFTMLSSPTYWFYDVLRGLEYFRSADRPDARCSRALELVGGKQDESGRWPLENRHQGPTHFRVDGPEGTPSRWITLRALRVMRWAGVD